MPDLELGQFFELASKYYGTDWAAMCFTFGQLYLLGNGKRVGFVFGILATISWTAFGIMAGSIANPIANSIFLIMNVRGLLKWTKMEASASSSRPTTAPEAMPQSTPKRTLTNGRWSQLFEAHSKDLK